MFLVRKWHIPYFGQENTKRNEVNRCFHHIIFNIKRSIAQTDKRWIKHQINTLSGTTMHGRGYVNKGGERAAGYISKTLQSFGLQSFNSDANYFQSYTFPVNTFPGNVLLKINRTVLEPGTDFLVHASSSSYITGDNTVKLHRINLEDVKDSASWTEVKAGFRPNEGYFLKHADTVTKYLKFSIRSFAREFPADLFIIPVHGKMTWFACTEQTPATILYVQDTVLPRHPRKAAADIEAKFNPAFKTQNIIAYVPGTEKPDSFMVFSAHYDHLGMMGKNALFPGAHDNASGTALVMSLARYFSAHPQRYSVVFMFFSGEEAGLLGSSYYVKHPLFPLEQIRFLVNLDMTGDATNGITMVNAYDNNDEYELMQKINEEKGYIPKINKREQTHNSDHYSFCEKGVPGIFIYGMGTKPYYHDVFDVAKEISLENIDGLGNMLIDFTTQLSGTNKINPVSTTTPKRR